MSGDHLEETEAHRADRTRIYGPLRSQRTDPAAERFPMVPLAECCAWCRDRLTPKPK